MLKLSSELRNRILTALFGVSLILFLLIQFRWWGGLIFGAVVSAAMLYEFLSLGYQLPDRKNKKAVSWILGVALFFLCSFYPEDSIAWFGGSFLFLSIFFLVSLRKLSSVEYSYETHFREWMYTFFGLFYLAVIPSLIPRFFEHREGLHHLLFMCIVVWSTDTFAYFVGKKFGKNKLFPVVSPKKTVEGAVGGLLGALCLALLYAKLMPMSLKIWQVIITAGLVSLIGQVGDLCESFLKRSLHQKDSGSLLPGHGGFLDRFDAVVFGLPVMYGCLKLFVR